MKNTKNKVCLYIFTHNKTGLKYFGKTTINFTEKELLRYGGSGSYWNRHLKKHGKDLSVEIYGIYNLDEVEEIALNFSEKNNIVIALNESGDRKNKKVWANEKPENGLDGNVKGMKFSEEHKRNIGVASKKKFADKNSKVQNSIKALRYSEYKTKEEMEQISKKKSVSVSGSKNPKAKHIIIYNDMGDIMYECFGNFKKTLSRFELPTSLVNSYKNKGIPINPKFKKFFKYHGWYAKII